MVIDDRHFAASRVFLPRPESVELPQYTALPAFGDVAVNQCTCPDDLEACGNGRCCERIDGQVRLSAGDHSTLDLALDTAGRAHLVTQPADSGDIEYLVANDDDSFTSEVVHFAESPDMIPGGQTLDIDPAGTPHIAFLEREGERATLYYTARNDGDNWTREVLGSVREGADPRMMLDSEDRPHIIYVRKDSTQVLYAWRNADGWQHTVVGNTVEGAPYSSERWVDIEMADGDVPVIAHVRADGRIRVVRLTQ